MATAMRMYTHDVSGTPAGDLAADVRDRAEQSGAERIAVEIFV